DSTSNVTESSGFSFNNLRIEAPDESGLVGYWKFDEGQGTVIHDASGTGNDGTLTSTSWTDSTPPAIDFDNHAGVTFNGSTSYGVLGTTSLPANNASQSISFWFNSGTNAGGTGNDMVTLWNGGSSSVTSVGIVGAGLLGVWKWGPITLVSTSAPSTGAWHHVVYTYKSTGTVNTLYVDGVSVSTSTTAPNSATPTAAEIGGFNGSNLYTGSIDDLRIYNVTLTATQVANLYAGGYSGVGSNTVVTLGANLTVNKTLAIDDGTLDTSTFTVNAAATDSTQTATVNGTLKVGSNTATFNGGLTIGKLGSVTENTAGGKVALGTRGVVEFDEPSGGAVGFPTAAFNWNTFAFWREYVTYSSYVGASTADTVLAMTADGGTKYSWPLPSAHGSLVGTPRWNTEGTSPGTQYIYLITTTGYVYKVLDDGTQLATVSGWPYHNGASATATSPLANDSSNLYWSGFAGDGTTPKIFSLTLAGVLNGTGLTIASNVTAAPALATVSATPYVFFAIASHVYQETLTLGTQITSTQPTTAVNGRVTVYNNIIYFPENNGKVWALNASASAPTTAWSYQDATGAVVSNIYVDVTANRTCFGDAAGYIYVLNSAGAALTGFPWQISSSDVFSIAPLSRNGVLLIGTAAGKVYEIDETNGTTRALTHTYTLPGGAAVSSISFNSSANAGNGAYTVGTSDGKLYYINAGTDPTSGNP
ncbi:MAG TPA: LamG-like jellyroll fold domain-containing protein, partial [Polyangia bacterium]|nr:LamG-like jellyroll fold domain-containing protein [Polyangia bacterium]